MGQSESLPDPQNMAQWEFKSNIDPFSPTEQPQWTAYKPYHNYLLEKAYLNKEKEVDLGDYIASLKDMLQTRKNDIFRQRPVRRNTEYFKDQEKTLQQEDKIRGKRFFGAEIPKTFTSTFGSLSHYLSFFQNRGVDIKSFANQFNEIETSKDIDQLNQKIHPCLIDCLRTESTKVPRQEKYEKDLLCLFQKPVTSIEQFYANILKAYTMEGFLYKNLNRYLRNEDWSQLHCLLPYAYCLCKAFFCTNLVPNPNEPQSQEKLTLYRGAQFDEASLSLYDKNTIKNFSWNSMTSTSRQRYVAEDFMYRDIDPTKKVPVLFVIEAPGNLEGNLKNAIWMDIKPFSAIPNEDEVVLPPGSVFEIMEISRDPHKGVEINLRLVTNINNLAHQGQIMHGALQSEMANEGELKFICLEGREFLEAITHLKGNQLIEALEFCLCKFSEEALLSLAETLKTISKLKKLTFISPSSTYLTHWSTLLKNLGKCAIETLEIEDISSFSQKDKVDLISGGIVCLNSLKSLTIDLSHCSLFMDKRLESLSSGCIKYLKSLTSLNLDFNSCGWITDEGLKSLACAGIRHLRSLTSLSLDFSYCRSITDKGMKSLSAEGIKRLSSLKSLTLIFKNCYKLTDEGVNDLSTNGIKNLKSLISLDLDFSQCRGIEGHRFLEELLQSYQKVPISQKRSDSINRSPVFERKLLDEALEKDAKELTKYTKMFYSGAKLQSFIKNPVESGTSQNLSNYESLVFKGYLFSEIEHMMKLLVQERNHFTLLTSLTLDLSPCEKITDGMLKSLNLEHIKHLTSLTSLHIGFGHESTMMMKEQIITDIGLKSLSNEVKNYLTSLTSLTLDFKNFDNITDEGLYSLASDGIRHLKSLTSLSLDFSFCQGITDKGLESLASEGIKHLTSLASLNLNFQECKRITNEGLSGLSIEGIGRHSNSLTSLNLHFACSKVTDKGLIELAGEGIKDLKSLTSLTMNFESCEEITDEGVKFLSWGIEHLKSLTSLKISFKYCYNITDEGLNSLVSEGIKHLHSLKYLALDFDNCSKITNSAMKNLDRILKYFGYLPSLKQFN